jgi:anti-anti-sigma factor
MLAAVPGCELNVERGPDWLLVRVANLDQSEADAPQFAERIWRLLQQHFTYRLVLELDQVRLLTSRILAQLIQLQNRIESRSGIMRLCGLSPTNEEVLHTCRLDERLATYQDRRAAVMGHERPRQPR